MTREKLDLSRLVLALCLVLALLVSIFFIAPYASRPDVHERDLSSIDAKIETVLKLTASSTLASAGISAIPSDTATPIAEKLADFTEYFLLILCVLYSEKYMITVAGTGVFGYLVPAVCALLIVCLFVRSKGLKTLAVKLAVFSLALYFIVPASIRVSDAIYDSYQSSIETTISETDALTDETSELAEAEKSGGVASILERLSETTDSLIRKASHTLNRYVETLAVMIVTSCVIPILVLLFFFWGVKQITGLDLNPVLPRRRKQRPAA